MSTVARTRISRVVLVTTVALALAIAGAVPVPAAADTADDLVPGQILVKFRPGAPEHAKGQARRDAGAAQVKTIGQLGVHVWRVPDHATSRALAGLQRNPHVEYAEQDGFVHLAGEVTPNDPWYRHQWGPRLTKASHAWSSTTGSSDVTIAIVDTGLSPSAEFAGKVLPGWNSIANSTDVTDTHGHGTRTASVASVVSNNGDGIAGYCWTCSLLPVKALDSSSGMMSDVASGIAWAADQGADVINMSFGGTSPSTTLLNALRYASSRNALLVAAAGNSGTDTPHYPAAYPEVIAVAGTNSSDTLYSWSTYGAWVDVSAPGINYSIGRDASIATFAGTSSASPAVAGIAGLAFSSSTRPTAAQVRQAINDGAVGIGNVVKHGRVDALSMLEVLSASPAPPAPAAPRVAIAAPSNGSTVSGSITVSGTAASNDSASVTKVVVTMGGTTRAASGTSAWSTSIDTSGLPEGPVRITATATTSTGASSTASVDVTVKRVPPAVTISSPSPEQAVSASFTVTGTAVGGSDATVATVDVRLGTQNWVRASGQTSWTATVDSTALVDGSHTLTARVTDSAGRTADHSITVSVQNPSEPDPPAPSLTVTISKTKGVNIGTLNWSPNIGHPATVLRDGRRIATVSSGTTYVDSTGTKGSATFSYQVCGATTCTAIVHVTY